MTEMKWRDTTSYSRGDKEKKPTSWSTRAGKLRVAVIRDHVYYPGQWVVHCRPFFDTYLLKEVETKEEAQAKAIELVKKEIEAIAADLDAAGIEMRADRWANYLSFWN